MPAPKQPQDRKPRTTRARAVRAVAAEASGAEFVFSHEGKTYKLPNARPYAGAATGADFMDAVLDDDDQAQMRLSVVVLKAAKDDIDPAAWSAIRSKPISEFLPLVAEWMTASGQAPGE